MREVEATMPAIASLEDLKAAQRRSIYVFGTPNASHLSLYDLGKEGEGG